MIAPVTRLWSVEDYYHRTLSPPNSLLIIEVADTTLKFDTEKKALVYASANITDYWVIDAITRQIYVFREPVAGMYTKKLVLSESSTVMPLAFPEIDVELVEFFTLCQKPDSSHQIHSLIFLS